MTAEESMRKVKDGKVPEEFECLFVIGHGSLDLGCPASEIDPSLASANVCSPFPAVFPKADALVTGRGLLTLVSAILVHGCVIFLPRNQAKVVSSAVESIIVGVVDLFSGLKRTIEHPFHDVLVKVSGRLPTAIDDLPDVTLGIMDSFGVAGLEGILVNDGEFVVDYGELPLAKSDHSHAHILHNMTGVVN